MRSCLARPISARDLADEALEPKIAQIFEDNYRVYGRRKIKAALARAFGLVVDRDRIGRLNGRAGDTWHAPGPAALHDQARQDRSAAPDLVKRAFADRPDAPWVSDFTYVSTWSGYVYSAFIIDVFARMVVGWRVSTTMTTDLVMDALEQAVWTRPRPLHGLVAHSDDGLSLVNTPPFGTPTPRGDRCPPVDRDRR